MATNSPLTRPTRTAPVTCVNGMCETCSAALAAIMARMSGSFSLSAERTEQRIWTSLMYPAGNSGRIGPVDEAGGERVLGGRPAFALDEPAGELAAGGHPFAVVDDEREPALGRIGPAFDGGDQDDGVAVAGDDGPVGLFGEFAGFEGERFATELQLNVACLHGTILSQWQERRQK